MYNDLLNVLGPVNIKSSPGLLAKFPPSYQQFANELGYGLLCELFIIYIPFDAPNEDHPDSLKIAMKRIRGYFQEYLNANIKILEDESLRSLIERAVPFGVSENGHFLFWDQECVRPDGEWAIYLADFPVSITHVADSLDELIRKITNSQSIRSIMRFRPEPLSPVFLPALKIEY